MRQFDEMYSRLPAAGDAGEVRHHYKAYARWLAAQDPQTMAAQMKQRYERPLRQIFEGAHA